MSRQKIILWALILTCLASFTVLLSMGSNTYREMPPIPSQVISDNGRILFTEEDIQQGQMAWRSMGGHQLGSVWGHGSYVAPDWSADWLHRELLAWLEIRAQGQFDNSYDALSAAQQSSLQAELKADVRRNRYNPETGTITLSDTRFDAIKMVQTHYLSLFGDDPELQPLREQYAMKEGTLPSLQRREDLTAFIFWSAWATATDRVDQPGVSYTNNWPHEPLVDNLPTSSITVWSILSVVVLIFGVAALAWYHSTLKHDPLPTPAKEDPIFSHQPSPSQRALGKYFLTAIGLFMLQIVLGGITAHYAVEGQQFYGIPLSDILPYSLTRTWHTQLAVFWIATLWLATGLYIAPALSGGREPKWQKLGVNLLWLALLVVVLGSMAGEWLAVQQVLDIDLSYWFGHQGHEYIDLGRFWQILLMVGLVIWLALVTAAIRPALKEQNDHKPVIWLLYVSVVAIGLFYGAGLMMGKHTNLAMAEYWRWWVVHLWVEGFFETFATAVIALMFVRLGLIRARSANAAVLFATLIFLSGGIIGTAHHWYFTGTPTSVLAWGSIFSALEVVPLALIGFEAYEQYRLRNAASWMTNYKWAIMFFVATAFWNMFGAGMLGFLINPPISLYYVQGLNTTAAHGHGAFMGVYGMLGIGLMLFCLMGLSKGRGWNQKLLKWAFWSMNIGLMAMLVMSLLPVGIIQFFAAIDHGYWFARSPEVLQSELVRQLVWWRVPGDILFAIGGMFIAMFLFGLVKASWAAKRARKLATA
ncbi:nitric-oxide reductase large subunit [Ferrimonas sediminicola]|uniref:Nitric-oxide reductase large subunit n=1 Tax=Ferrimonas sediminicola TaxID=2569538 RepID=A0A4U1B723_9GAMM|nr:nitric-oxide reductase large subunit [Ferrimonas sediminicola]TKB45994.1 nitric-oxide reductase large subunit [Ferrimonas sediminicola]